MLLTSIVVSELRDGSIGRAREERSRMTSTSGTQVQDGRGVHEEGECEGGRALSERAERKVACEEEPQKAAAT
jgi:hypothetical protein